MRSRSPSPSAHLSAEPSLPEDRAALGLPPISYVQAVVSRERGMSDNSAFQNSGSPRQIDSQPSGAPSLGTQGLPQWNGLTSSPLPRGAHTHRWDSRSNRANGSQGSGPRNSPSNNSRPGASERIGLRWAPLNIGLDRRLQTLIVLCHTISMPIFLTAFFFSCAIPLFWPLLLPYLVYISLFSDTATSGALSRRSSFLRSLRIWNYFASYFPARLHRSVPSPLPANTFSATIPTASSPTALSPLSGLKLWASPPSFQESPTPSSPLTPTSASPSTVTTPSPWAWAASLVSPAKTSSQKVASTTLAWAALSPSSSEGLASRSMHNPMPSASSSNAARDSSSSPSARGQISSPCSPSAKTNSTNRSPPINTHSSVGFSFSLNERWASPYPCFMPVASSTMMLA
ncbi:diacylglycerol O-acyltransferase [Histoplasma capsulatum H143]|uniref:Diacylglycerol O-acyltransferase n=1 Tax=Ajellomyces capsulatus (strain H143) TaxID=544712 RepID=C6HSI6_AJECH|nr:diacylglycerol O-acyltransferase [Histoplasma capsulatum H143]